MAENKFSCAPQHGGQQGTVCIDANRILDCCRDRDCFENARVMLTCYGNEVIEHTSNVRIKDACIAWTYIGIEPIPFNRGFYAIDIKFYIKIVAEACLGPGRTQEFDGITVLEKKVVLFGGESNAHVFRSTHASTDFCAEPQVCEQNTTAPEAVIEVVDPIILGVKVLDNPGECSCCCCCCSCADVPETANRMLSGPVTEPHDGGRYLAVSIGLFSIIRLMRPAQYLIGATEYTVPDKECVATEENDPCSLFRTMSFPTEEFNTGYFPVNNAPGCGMSALSSLTPNVARNDGRGNCREGGRDNCRDNCRDNFRDGGDRRCGCGCLGDGSKH